MTAHTESAIPLSQSGANGRARAAALAAAAKIAATPTSLVSYRSTGAVVVIGPAASIEAAIPRLHPALRCTAVVTDGKAPAQLPAEVPLLHEKVIQVTGHLGQFAVIVTAPPPQGGLNLLQKLGSARTHFDLVLDLSDPPFLSEEMLPFGYYAPGTEAAALEQTLTELPEMTGEFDKPRFFNYNPDICAHGANGATGCTRCLDACPANAIVSIHDEVAVDPYRCQGAGICATVCPSGAMTYVYPSVADHLARLSALLKTYRADGGSAPVIVYYDAEVGRQRMQTLAARLPEHAIPIEIAELGSVGIDIWLSALAYGAARILLLPTFATPRRVLTAVESQIGYAAAVLDGMGYAPGMIRLLEGEDDDVLTAIGEAASAPAFTPAAFAAFDEKRTTLRLAVEHLFAHAPQPRAEAPLPAGAPFGQVLVNRDTCTLCMACVGACPVGALTDGGELPQLQFIEGNCVQCGLCEATCPENAISLAARYLYEPDARRAARVLHEEAPFHCIVCGKPFATRRMMQNMEQKLGGHWMFQTDEAKRRIQMCGDCRVRDVFKAEHKKSPTM